MTEYSAGYLRLYMEKYREEVEALADARSETVIPNGTLKHATILIENLLSHAHKKVQIFSGRLNEDVYASDPVLQAARYFLERSRSGAEEDTHLEILVQDPTESLESHPLLNICRQVGEGICKVKRASGDDSEIGSHFIVADRVAYRFEPDRNEPAAIACFNSPSNGEKLGRFFDEMFNRGNEIAQEIRA